MHSFSGTFSYFFSKKPSLLSPSQFSAPLQILPLSLLGA